MILFFHNKIKNTEAQVFEEIIDTKIPTISEFASPLPSTVVAFMTPTEQPVSTCTYPIRVEDMFPFWLRQTTNGTAKLILMTKAYYDWLSCGMTENDVSFLGLEDLIDIESIPDTLLQNQLFTYVNGFPVNRIKTADTPDGNIDPVKIRKLLDNVRVNVYTKKGTEESFKLVLETLFDIPANNISISYPKRYVLRLNGGRYDWMRDDYLLRGEYSSNPLAFNPQLSNSYLNHSVLQDGSLWQEFSYVLNIAGLTAADYENVVRPLLHPAGMKDFYDVNKNIFNNLYDNTYNVTYEIPVIKNYAVYSLLDSQTLPCESGCSLGVENPGYPFQFPSWEEDIFAKYYAGMTFGQINIVDFLKLTPASGFTFVNETSICSNCS
jgi:hypothetical protein